MLPENVAGNAAGGDMAFDYVSVILTNVRTQGNARCRLRRWILTFVRMTEAKRVTVDQNR
ncbi:hypothetical protein ASF00_14010 [Sphingomonas sp. Leaf34]|nr:hypothetical protein ASF00_14010 [Sphingomonas sp. Leaf34]